MKSNIATFWEPSWTVFDICVVVRVSSVNLGESFVRQYDVVPRCALLITRELAYALSSSSLASALALGDWWQPQSSGHRCSQAV